MRRALILAFALSAAAPALMAQQTGTVQQAPDTALERRTRELASQLRCPVCQGLSIQDSPTELAQDMKAVVREQLAQGKSEEEVTAYFVEKYGEWILLQPKAEGFNLTVYLLPVFSLVLGGGVVAMGIRRWTRNAPPASDEPLEPEY